jgi:hypothetical protein
MISLLFSLSSLWTASRANGSLPVNGGASTYLGLKDLHAQEKGGRTEPRVGQAGQPGPTGLAHPGPTRSSLLSHGSLCLYALWPLHLHYFHDTILVSKMEVLLA